MSISNIFKCCKKTEISLAISGIVLGAYLSLGYMTKPTIKPAAEIALNSGIKVDQPMKPIITVDKKNTVEQKITIDQEVPYEYPFSTSLRGFINRKERLAGKLYSQRPRNNNINANEVPIYRPNTVENNPPLFDLNSDADSLTWFRFFMNSSQVVIRGGLAVISLSGITYAISAMSYYVIKTILQRIQNRNPANPIVANLNPQIPPNRNQIRPINNEDLEDTLNRNNKDENEKKIEEEYKKTLEMNKKLDALNQDFDTRLKNINKFIFEIDSNVFVKQPSNVIFEEDEKEEIDEKIEIKEEEILEQVVDDTEVDISIEAYEIFKTKLKEIMKNYTIKFKSGNIEFNLSENEINDLFSMINLPMLFNLTENLTTPINQQANYFISVYEQVLRLTQDLYRQGGVEVVIDSNIIATNSYVEINEIITANTIDNELRFEVSRDNNYFNARAFFTTLSYLFNILSKVGFKYKFIDKNGKDNFLIMLEYLLKDVLNLNREQPLSKKIIAYKALVSIIKDMYLNLHYKK